MRRAIIHIGMPRTGSTSFQGLLARVRARLPEAGILYPELAPADLPEAAREALNVNHQALGEALDGRRPGRRAALAQLSETLAATQADTVVLSYEDFAVQKPSLGVPAMLAEVFARHGFALEAAIVVKPPFEQLNSAYAHRAQLAEEFRDFRGFGRLLWRSRRFDYGARLAPWRAAARGRVTATPLRDGRSGAPLLERLLRDLGLWERLAPLVPDDATRRTDNRSSGPLAVEASRRLRRMRVHRQVPGHPRIIGHVIDEAAWSRGLDTESFRGDAPEIRARMEARFAPLNEAFARDLWGASWESVVASAARKPPNEIAGHPTSPEQEAQIALLMHEAIARFGFRRPPPWRRLPAELFERAGDEIAWRTGYSRWKVV
ncbi:MULTISPECIES: hypothetical protein [Methylobacterium]|uniref:Sulfotransferase family protein n=2 Tax=Pseudomonadota TaxID=1224 RepID=A0ABQ4SR04_9HYPH|nr:MULTISPECIES: hypothetical protein [Methylobacterium]PIU07859.1 MAG: hypothetical protein COT56_03660 [Methylobacterium sp. CG09_land_8_20_14_0_10_71_15]PIU11058.1 MAG: hypothetical protein COT28_21955 [Methylobacterium sp. CG08_land_8_20_14_0_20_71_15]GBU16019.1 hypothetical protein AwMethylo_02340 [Methylobacterium sp.]GJE05651.1 hypothetical protein AOPFMNJM_0955 [Methylobacterium jeotgali]